MESDLVCGECGSTEIEVECLVLQKAGELRIMAICDEGHCCAVCGSEHITERIGHGTALKEIQGLLDKTEWSAETAEQVAQIVRRTGLPVREPMVDEPDEDDADGAEAQDPTLGGSITAVGPTYGAAPGGA